MLVPQNYSDRRVVVLGCGYVGLTLAVVMADCGFEVLGVEIRTDVLDALNKGKAHFHEPGLEPKLHRLIQSGALKFVRTLPEDLDYGVFIITVGTPLNDEGRARLDMVRHVTGEIVECLKPNNLVIMRSTVKLGTTRREVMPILDKAGVPYDLAFCPERTIEGQALSELRSLPQIVGGDSLKASVRASQLFQFITPTTVRVSSLETAEMIKLVDNSQRDVFFGFSNEVARLCDASAINAAEVIRAGRHGYPRTQLALPGPVGGPCLSKDPYILAESFEDTPITPEIIMSARRTNERQPCEVAEMARIVSTKLPDFPKNPIVALLGIAFKGRPETDDLRGTMARPLLDALKAAFPTGRFRGWDAVVPTPEIERFGLSPAKGMEDAFASADLIVLANNHPVFAGMPIELLAKTMAPSGLVFDLWNNFDPASLAMPAGRHYITLGSAGVFLGMHQ